MEENGPFCAPEIKENKEPNEKIDVYSVGVCLFYLLFQDFPVFPEKLINMTYEKRQEICLKYI